MARAAAAVIATIAALVASVAGTAAEGTRDARLLARYAPILTLHPQEQLSPVAVDGYLADSDLTVKAADGAWVRTVIPLETAPRATRLDQRLCRASDGPDAASCYSAAQAAHGTTPAAYGAVFHTGTRIALQYWLFYPFNPYEQLAPPGRFWQAHEGDWEAVTVLLDRAERPLLVGLSRHCAGVRRAWARVPRRSTHPLVYVALGSHANYFGPVSRPLERRCWPPEALAVYDAYGVTLVDRASRGRAVRPRVVRVTGRSPGWMRYRGAWGETQYVGFPNVDPLAFGSGPAGPAFHDLWRKPVAAPLAWPAG